MSADTLSRQHPVYLLRANDWRNARLCVSGGQEYVDARLHRVLGETTYEWNGNISRNIPGRATISTHTRDAARVAAAITESLFSKLPNREGLDDEWAAYAGTQGDGLDSVWRLVNDYVTECGFAWVAVDTTIREPALLQSGVVATEYDRRASGAGPVFHVLHPTEVVDWRVGLDGRVQWCIVQLTEYDDDDPFTPRKERVVRYVLDATTSTKMLVSGDPLPAEDVVSRPHGLTRCPVVLVGSIPPGNHWFADCERLNAEILNVRSINARTMRRTSFPIRVVPQGTLQRLERDAAGSEDAAEDPVGVAFDESRPIEENEDSKGTTRVIEQTVDFEAMHRQVGELRKELREMVGFGMRQETRQVKSGDAYRFEQSDQRAFLQNRASIIEAGERRAVELAAEVDPAWSRYEVLYSRDFDSTPLADSLKALIDARGSGEWPDDVDKGLGKAIIQLIADEGGAVFDDVEAMLKAMDEWEPEPPLPPGVPSLVPDDDGGSGAGPAQRDGAAFGDPMA